MDMSLGERIRKVRKGKMTQAELAHLIGVHEITVRRWELGERTPDVKDIQKIADVLSVPASDLLGDSFAVSRGARGNEALTMSYWGGVLDNARVVAANGDKEEIADVSHLLTRALASLRIAGRESSQPAMA